MGYCYYEFADGRGPRGYGVDATCAANGCDREIDKGMAYLCYRCTNYFCGEHRTFGVDEECFAGVSGQVCLTCSDEQLNDEAAAAPTREEPTP